MELRQLAYLDAVARCGGFTRAAEQLHVAQPAISAQIRRLERELGVTLFERTTRRVGLTHAGDLVLARARSALAAVDGIRDDLDDLAAVVRGRLRVGVTSVLGGLDLAELLAGFHRRYPGVDLAVRDGFVAELLSGLDAGDLDTLVAPMHDDLPERFVARVLARERVVLIVPAGHPFRDGEQLAALREDAFVCLREGSGLHAILCAAAAEQGFAPRIPFEAPDPRSIRALVAAGLGVALLAESAALGPGPDVAVHRLRPEPSHPPIGLIRRRERRPTPVQRAWQRHVLAARTSPGD